jgi:TRAP-type C4-dicarboxylate transport system permease small subunit
MTARLVLDCISVFLLSLFAYFLWRMVIRQFLSPTLAGELREIRFIWVGTLGGVHPILM